MKSQRILYENVLHFSTLVCKILIFWKFIFVSFEYYYVRSVLFTEFTKYAWIFQISLYLNVLYWVNTNVVIPYSIACEHNLKYTFCMKYVWNVFLKNFNCWIKFLLEETLHVFFRNWVETKNYFNDLDSAGLLSVEKGKHASGTEIFGPCI